MVEAGTTLEEGKSLLLKVSKNTTVQTILKLFDIKGNGDSLSEIVVNTGLIGSGSLAKAKVNQVFNTLIEKGVSPVQIILNIDGEKVAAKISPDLLSTLAPGRNVLLKVL